MNIISKAKILLFIVFTVTSLLGTSQEERVINLGDFRMVKVFSGVVLELVRADEQKIVILGEKRENLSVKNTNGKLKVFLKFPEIYNDKEVIIKLYYKEDLEIIDANEGAGISCNQTFIQDNITLRSQEGAYIHLNLDAKYITTKTVSGGIIRLRGNVINQDVEATSGGVYESYELESETAEVTSASGARVEVNVSDRLDANVRFGGEIHYIGNPERIKKNKLIGGKIINKS